MAKSADVPAGRDILFDSNGSPATLSAMRECVLGPLSRCFPRPGVIGDEFFRQLFFSPLSEDITFRFLPSPAF